MPTVRLAQTSFALGEFSPLMAARSDIAQYKNGAARLENRRVLAQGGTDTRPGSRLLGPVPQGHGRLLPYIFSADQRYLLRLAEGLCQPHLTDGTLISGFVAAPWTAGQLFDIKFDQSGDTMLLFHPDWPPQRIRRASATAFVLDAMPVEYFPYIRFDFPAAYMTPSGMADDFTMLADAPLFTSDTVGLRYRYKGKVFQVLSLDSATLANCRWLEVTDGTDGGASQDWEEQAWSNRRGWPISGVFIEGRLAVGGSRSLPNMVWLSKTSAPFNFQTGTLDDDAIAVTAAGAQSGRIVHLVAASRLLIFTDGAVWSLISTSTGPLTPKTVALRPAAGVGAAAMRPAEVDGATVFLDRSGGMLREIEIDDVYNRFTANPVSLLAEHLIRQPRAMTVLRGSPDRPEIYALLVNQDGGLASYLSLRNEKIAAFSEWTTAGAFRDICAVGPDLFALTERFGGWWLERFDEDAAPLDFSARTVMPTRTRAFNGFRHLIGQTVAVTSRGHDLGDAPVNVEGTVILPDSAPAVFEVEAGLRYRQAIRPMSADFDLPAGPVRGQWKRLLKVTLQVHDSGPARVAGRRILFPLHGDDVDTPPPRKTGLIEARMLGVSQDLQFDVEVQGAQKMTLLSLTREISTNG